MKLTLGLVLLCCSLLGVKANVVGQIDVSGQTLYVWRQFGSVSVANNAVTIQGNSRAYLLQNEVTVIGPGDYYQMTLSGKTLSYTLDVSRVPCHCNAAVYFSAMPAPESGSNLDYYCDGNCVGGQCCPEYDAIESNKHTLASTLHKCDVSGDWYTNCDGAGCGVNCWDVDQNAVGQGKMIDTASPFRMSHYQSGSEATVTVTQDSDTFSWSACNDANYLTSMNVNLEEGMVPILSQWGSEDTNEMWWLDDKTGCQPEGGVVGCDIDNAIVVYSDIRLE